MIRSIAKPFAKASLPSTTNPLIIAFEGTGLGWSTVYPGGFMDQVRSRLGASYIKGPDAANLASYDVMEKARNALKRGLLCRVSRPPIVLVGWSRGGAAAIQLAREMAEGWNFDQCFEVDALILLDAVDRSSFHYSSDPIPRNVLRCYHAYRDPGVDSRRMFGNTGMQWEGHPEFRPETFWATHAAFGGLPGAFGGLPLLDDNPSSANVRRGNWNSEAKCYDLLYTDTSISCAEDVVSARRIAKWLSACFARHSIYGSFAPIVPANCPGRDRKEIILKCEPPLDTD